MINVVFLLLVFFLLSASLAPPDPFPTEPPVAEGPDTDPQPGTLHISPEGALAYGPARGEAVWAALGAHQGPLPVRVDGGWSAADLAALLPRLAEVGIGDIRLMTVRP